jgi:hypothetical protein
MHADPGLRQPAFSAAHALYDSGIDFDFIDYQSLARATVSDGRLHVAGEHYRVLVMDDLRAVRFSSLRKAQELFRSGGVVLGTGELPSASDRTGAEDQEIDAIEKELFGLTAAEASTGQSAETQSNDAMGIGIFLSSPDTIGTVIKESITCDFLPAGDTGHVQHRRIGRRDLYMVMDVDKGEECFFRSHGKVELWDAQTAEVREIPVVRETKEGTVLKIPVAPPKSCFIVFSPGRPLLEDSRQSEPEVKEILPLSGKWECEMVPTLNNRWGDFRLPATSELIGPEARQMRYAPEEEAGLGWQSPGFDDSRWERVTCDFGPRMWQLHIPSGRHIDSVIAAVAGSPGSFDAVKLDQDEFSWEPYAFSWRWGVEDQPGSQGYHGLKGKVSDHFLIMGKEGHYLFSFFVEVPDEMEVRVLQEGKKAYGIWIDGQKLIGETLELSAGQHQVMICFNQIKGSEAPRGPHPIDLRERAAVVLVKEGTEQGERMPLSMKWHHREGLLTYDIYGDRKRTGCYRFTAPPGLQEISFPAHGHVKLWVEGDTLSVSKEGVRKDGAVEYRAKLSHSKPGLSTVALQVDHEPGYYKGAAFPEQVTLTCGDGMIQEGNWSEMGVLRHYSGGMWYRKRFIIKPAQIRGSILMDLGKVGSTCEIHLNSHKAGTLIAPPYSLDITDYIQAGENLLEILVYNTLANHYQTIPTPDAYKEPTASGLLGPVKIIQLTNMKQDQNTK